MAAPKYLVTIPPGVPVPGVGFVRPGEIFAAPEDYPPSRTFRPINQEAAAQLRALKAELQDRAKALRVATDKTPEEVRTDRKKADQLEKDAASISVELFELPRVEKPVEEGVTLAQLARADAELQSAVKDGGQKAGPAKAGADRKL